MMLCMLTKDTASWRFLLTNVLNSAEFLRDNKNGKEATSIVKVLKTLAKSNALRIRFWF